MGLGVQLFSLIFCKGVLSLSEIDKDAIESEKGWSESCIELKK